MPGLILVLTVLALVTVLASATGRSPLWVPVFLLVVIELVRILPK